MSELSWLGDELAGWLESYGDKLQRRGDGTDAPPVAPQWPDRWTEAHAEVWAETRAEEGRRPQCRARPIEAWRDCRICRGAGFVFGFDEKGYERGDPCRCQALRERIDAFNAARLPPESVAKTLDGFDWKLQAEALPVFRGLVRTWSPSRTGLFVHGTNGTGKTHLLCATVRRLTLEHAVSARYVRWPDLVDDVHEAMNTKRSRASVLDPLKAPALLVVDELGGGATGANEFHAGIAEEVIGRRVERGLVVLVATNLDPEAKAGSPMSLEGRVGRRTASRLHACETLQMVGEDYRRRGQP